MRPAGGSSRSARRPTHAGEAGVIVFGGGGSRGMRAGCVPGGCLGMLAVSILASLVLTVLLNLLVNH